MKPPAPPAWIMQPAPDWQTPLNGIISPSESRCMLTARLPGSCWPFRMSGFVMKSLMVCSKSNNRMSSCGRHSRRRKENRWLLQKRRTVLWLALVVRMWI
ncbi:Rz1 family lipoprotein [Escherichia coli]|uniref:Rz1 family lipoprotein n=1 Tax=Escherichia coli TaxID=562 RepID=UPI0024DEC8DF|nr:Rz1 family lipoprotein [Escherichia coli]MDK2428409.1 Rz1 family lipoprotein [Escherichia coli]MDK2547406.1 Rz1 family lipoprotein [Escherichia coli]MEB5732856.1 Rz1 family lipoprotein [Escherichia coli]